MYTFEPKKDPDWKPYVGDPFDISLDPVRMTEMAAGALMFLRGDVKPARQTVERTYSTEQVMDAGLLPADCAAEANSPTSRRVFRCRCRWNTGFASNRFDGPPTAKLTTRRRQSDRIRYQRIDLVHIRREDRAGHRGNGSHAGSDRFRESEPQDVLKNLSADITNNFATIVLSSMDDKPLAQSDKMLLNACSRVANTDEKWNDAHTGLGRGGQGHSPTLIEPVTGTVTLRNIRARNR